MALVFQPASPFPLILDPNQPVNEMKAHAEQVDRWLGLATVEIETRLIAAGCRQAAPNSHQRRQELWIGLAIQNLLTPYTEIRRVLHILNPKPGETVVDLGTAYGRLGFIIGRHYPDVNFVGYEYVGERLFEARRCLKRFSYPRIRLEHIDLSARTFKPTAAEHYFIYDYGEVESIDKTLFDLRKISESRPISVITRGKRCRELIEKHHSWLQPSRNSTGTSMSQIYATEANN